MNLELIQDRFKEIGVTNTSLSKKEVKYLPNVLSDREMIMYATSGMSDGNNWMIVCTDSRLIFLDKGLIYGLKQVDIPLEKINSVSFNKGMIFGDITVHHGSASMKITMIEKSTVEKMAASIKNNIANSNNTSHTNNQTIAAPDVSAQIRQLKNLLDDGILTEEEFSAKKKQLLGL